MIPDMEILEGRIAAMRDVPWPIQALILIEMTDEDLDCLEAAADKDEYWTVLNETVTRIKEEA